MTNCKSRPRPSSGDLSFCGSSVSSGLHPNRGEHKARYASPRATLQPLHVVDQQVHEVNQTGSISLPFSLNDGGNRPATAFAGDFIPLRLKLMRAYQGVCHNPWAYQPGHQGHTKACATTQTRFNGLRCFHEPTRAPCGPLIFTILERVDHRVREDCRRSGEQACEEEAAAMRATCRDPRGNAGAPCWDSSTVVGQDTEAAASGGCTIRGQASEVLRLHRHLRSVHSRASMAALLTQLSNGVQHQKPVPLP